MFKKFLLTSAAVAAGTLVAKATEKSVIWGYNKYQNHRAAKAAEKASTNGKGNKNKEQAN